jgi:serine phosphatase RsbU (regulator of sigma subunit)
MKKIFVLSLFLAASLFSFSQSEIDVLRSRAHTVSKDSAASCYSRMAFLATQVSPDTVRFYAEKALQLASQTRPTYGDALIQIGNSFSMKQKTDSALAYYNKALSFYKKINNKRGLAKADQSFAVVYYNISEFKTAIEKGRSALAVYKEIGFSQGIIGTNSLLSNSYSALNNQDSALFYIRCAMSEAAKNKADSTKYYQIMIDYGMRLNTGKTHDSTLYYLNKAAGFMERNKSYGTLINLYLNQAQVKMFADEKKADTRGARELALKAYNLANTYNIKESYKLALDFIYSTYVWESSNKDSIFKYLTLYQQWIDTLNDKDQFAFVKDVQTKYETEKKDLQIKNQSLEIDAKEKENAAKNRILLLGTFALLSVAVFGFIAYSNFKKTKKANIIINNQKEQVELQKEEIEDQKILVEVKQKEIIDSINYAQKIQTAVLTSDEVWKKISPEYFIIFSPKDIVSGDFYWAYNTVNNRSVFALADCTGHGVPGGFMSMLGNSFLNELVVENKLFKADIILNKLRDKIINALGQKGSADRKDGMDMALCVWNKLENTLEFAGANNGLWLIRNGELITYQGNKMPIGQFSEELLKPFSSQTIQLQKNDLIVLCTDGFADQFGGEDGKKLKSKNLKEFLAMNAGDSLSQQKINLTELFSNWKGNHQQVDDVSLIMIKVV